MYWLAFQEKLKIPLGPTQKAITFLTAVCDPNFALVARDTAGNILGVAGIKTAKGGLIGGSFAQLRDVYGTWGATWRAAMLSVLERPVKPDVLLMDGIDVGAAARGKGVGTKLLNTLIEHAESHNFAAIRLDVIDKNHGAQRYDGNTSLTNIGVMFQMGDSGKSVLPIPDQVRADHNQRRDQKYNPILEPH